jgi:prophage regulatory protein
MSAKQLLAHERERKNTKRHDRAERQARRILRLPEVQEVVGLKHATIYLLMSQGAFPRPVSLGPRAVGWLRFEIDDWLEARIAERDNGTAVRSLPLAGLNQRRKIEATPKETTLDRGTAVPSSKKSNRREARRVGGRGQRETIPLGHDACRGNRRIGK